MEYAMYFVINKSLNMSTGKMLAQFGHAVTGVIHSYLSNINADDEDYIKLNNAWAQWMADGQTKVVLEASEKEFMELRRILTEEKICHTVIVDEGRTEVPENSSTIIGIFPGTKEDLKPYVGNLKLYKDEGQKAIALLKELVVILKKPEAWSGQLRITIGNYMNFIIKPKESYAYLLSLIQWV